MATNIGTINVVFQADVATAVAGLRSLSQQLDASIANSVARSNQFSAAVSTMSNNLAASIAKTASGAQGFSNTVSSSFGQIPTRLGSVVSQITRNGAALNNSLGTIAGQLTVTVDQATRKTRDLAGAFSLLTTVISAFSLKSFIDAVGTYDQQLEAIRVLTRETAVEFKATREAVLSLAQGLQVSAVDVAKGLNEIVQAGFTAADGLKVLEASIKASKVGLTSTAVASSALIQTLNAFGIAAGDSEATVGKLVRAVDLGVFSFERLATNIGQAAPLAATIGVRLEELLALFTALTRKEANLDEVTTQVRASFSDLLAPSDRARAAMEKVLGTTVEASVRTRGFTDTLRRLISAADGSAAALAQMFPNIRAMAGLSKLVGEGFSEFTDDIGKLEKASVGSLNRALSVANKSFGNLVNQIKATAANSLIDYFERNRAAFITYAEAVDSFLKRNPDLLANIAKAAVTFAALATAVGLTRIAVSGLTLAIGALSSAGAALRFIFSGQAIVALTAYVDRFDLLLAKFSAFSGFASRTPQVVQQAVNAQQAAATAAAAYTKATQTATAASNAAIVASQNMANARKAELAADNALTLARQRQAVADARVAGLTLAASNRNPITGQFKSASQSAANLLPSAAKDLAAANREVALSQAALTAAETARTSSVTRATVAATALATAEAEVATTSAAATAAASAEAAAMARLTAATGSAAGAQAALASATAASTSTAGATALATVAGKLSTLGTAAASAAKNLGLLALAGAAFVAKAAAVAIAAGLVGLAIGKIIEKVLEFFGIIENRSGLKPASDALLQLVENQKRFNEEVNRADFAKRISEGEKAAANLTERLQNLADLARSAAAGNTEAAQKFAALSREFEKDGGKSGVSRLLDKLKGQYGDLATEVQKAIDAQVALGDQGVQGLARVDSATGKVIGTTANLLTVLTAAFGEVRAREVVQQLGEIEVQMKNVQAATAAYASATFDLRNKNISLAAAIKEAGKTVAEYSDKIKEIADAREKAGLTGDQKEARALDEERQKLADINDILETRARLIRETSIKATGGVTPEAKAAINSIREQQTAANKAISENDAAYTKLYEEELQKRVNAATEASDRIAEAEIESLKLSGDALEADFRAAELGQAKRLRAIEAERSARVKAVREAVGLSDAERQAEIDKINKQADEEIAASDRVFKAKLNAANDEEFDRQKKTEAGKKAEEEKEKIRKQNEALKEADQLADKIREAEINGEIEKRNDLVAQYVRKLEEAGRAQEAQLVREREMNRSASQRVQLLQDEIRDRLRAGQGAQGVVEAARSAQSNLTGSNDVGSFRGGVRGKLGEFNSEAEAKKFVDTVTAALKTEYDALEVQRREALSRGDKKTADEIAQKQREVVVKYEALLDEIARREAELKAATVQVQNQQPNSATSTAKGVQNNQNQQPVQQNGSASGGATTVQPTPATNALPGAVNRVADATTRLVASIEASSKATITAAQTISAKLDQAVKVLNTHTTKINEVDLRVQRLRIVSVNNPE